jgi:hypothetical protein
MNGFILTGSLAPRHRDAGLTLVEDEDFLQLKHDSQQEPIAVFSSKGAKIEEIVKEADKWLEQENTKRWRRES